MSANVAWREIYRAALLELHQEELARRIDDAEKAIRQRMEELRLGDFNAEQESRELDDALRGLRDLASTECMLPGPTPSGSAQGEVAS